MPSRTPDSGLVRVFSPPPHSYPVLVNNLAILLLLLESRCILLPPLHPLVRIPNPFFLLVLPLALVVLPLFFLPSSLLLPLLSLPLFLVLLLLFPFLLLVVVYLSLQTSV